MVSDRTLIQQCRPLLLFISNQTVMIKIELKVCNAALAPVPAPREVIPQALWFSLKERERKESNCTNR